MMSRPEGEGGLAKKSRCKTVENIKKRFEKTVEIYTSHCPGKLK